MRSQIVFLRWLIPLMLAVLACSLTAKDEQDGIPTNVPTLSSVGQNTLNLSSPAPSLTARPTNTSAPVLQPTPSCTVRTDWAVITIQAGETLSAIARRTGVSVDQLVAGNCLANPNSVQAGQSLRVPVVVPSTIAAGTPIPATATGCTTGWFFSFNSNISDNRCPNPVVFSRAVGQDFEGGRVFWYEAAGVYNVTQIYVAFNDGGWAVYGDTWNSSLPASDPSIVPPVGRYQPVGGIGYVWRTQPGLRQKLGWAYEPEQAFSGRRQEPIYPANSTQKDLYIDYGKRGLVLRLSQPTTGNATWVVAGGY